jgi:hypothetical protein
MKEYEKKAVEYEKEAVRFDKLANDPATSTSVKPDLAKLADLYSDAAKFYAKHTDSSTPDIHYAAAGREYELADAHTSLAEKLDADKGRGQMDKRYGWNTRQVWAILTFQLLATVGVCLLEEGSPKKVFGVCLIVNSVIAAIMYKGKN